MNLRSVRESLLLFLINVTLKIFPALFKSIIVVPLIKFLQILCNGECAKTSLCWQKLIIC